MMGPSRINPSIAGRNQLYDNKLQYQTESDKSHSVSDTSSEIVVLSASNSEFCRAPCVRHA